MNTVDNQCTHTHTHATSATTVWLWVDVVKHRARGPVAVPQKVIFGPLSTLIAF